MSARIIARRLLLNVLPGLASIIVFAATVY